MKFSRLIYAAVMTIMILSISAAVVTAQLTTPESYLGYKPGADFKLINYEEAIGYFELLAGQTDRMIIMDMGPTSMDRRMKYAVVSSEENMANLERYKEITKKLSLARGVTPEEAQAMADEGKAIIWIDGGLHASEVAPAQHLVQFVYDLVTGEDRTFKLIRENVITLLVFVNPDGMTLVSDWYKKNLGTPYEVSRMPFLYHKYVGHDNNRDSYIANIQETKNISRAVNLEWYPNILFNQHQTAPFPARIWIPPESEPTNPNLHPLVVRLKNLIGSAMGKAFEEEGQDGAISRILFDSWYPGYVTQIVDSHNIPSILTETALYRYATPHYYTLQDFPESQRDLVMGTFYPTPWKGGWWRIGDAVNYNLTASKSVLEVAAKYRYEFLINKYNMASDIIKKFKSEPPYGYILHKEQVDPNSAALLVNRMRLLGTEIYSAGEEFEHNGITYPEGSYIIPTSQPFGYFVKNILEKQVYPSLEKYSHLWQGIVGLVTWDGAPLRPYDGVGWTLPIQFGLKYNEMSSPLDVDMNLLSEDVKLEGSLAGGGSNYIFSAKDNNSYMALNRILEAGGNVRRALTDFSAGEKDFTAGDFIASGSGLSDIAKETGVDMTGANPRVETKTVKNPRIALYRSWRASMDAGWISYIFDEFGLKFHDLRDAEVRAGNLKERFDVIVFADERAGSIINGNQKGTIHPDYVGGITKDGVENLRKFVKAGGIMICNNGSTDLPISSFKLPLKNVVQSMPPDSFYIPGSLLKVNYDKDHPVAFGMPENGMAMFSRGRAFEIIKPGSDEKKKSKTKAAKVDTTVKPVIVASFPEEPLLISGWVNRDDRIRGAAAVVDVPYGDGNIVLFGFNIHNRAQARATFKLLFNSMYLK